MYQKHNANPKGRKTGDCVIRAFSLASGKTWEDTLTDLYRIAMDLKTSPTESETYAKYADQLGFVSHKVELVNGHKPTPKTFAQSHPAGTFVLRLAHHVVTVKDGVYYDIWDCGAKSVYKYWEVMK